MPQLEENEKEQIYVKKKTKLTMITDKEHKEVPLVDLPPGYHAESLTPKEKTSRIKKIISSIPIDKDQLFSYKVMWDHVDKVFFFIILFIIRLLLMNELNLGFLKKLKN